MTHAQQSIESETLAVLEWARALAPTDEVVGAFWSALCKAVREPADAPATRVYEEIGAYGGNSICNAFRDAGGVSYGEVAYDVAEKLRRVFADAPYSREETRACERFVLREMAVSQDNLDALCAAMAARGLSAAVAGQVAASAAAAAAEGAGYAVGREVAKRVALKAAAEAAEQAGKKAAQEVAKRVAAEVLAQVAAVLGVVGAVWLLIDIAGPATRVIIPAVTYVALLRKLHDAATEAAR
jgi:uncharacterized protein YaaW (UPF0174 family)